MRQITSVKNPAVQAARALQTAKGRAEQNAFVCDGEHMVTEALTVCPERVRAVFVDEARAEEYRAALSRARADGSLRPALPGGDWAGLAAEVYAAPASVLKAISQVKTPQGIAAVCGLPAPMPPGTLDGRLVLLENVQDPGNVGTILRTLDAAGFDGCVLTRGCADPYAPKTLRATMGSVFRVPISLVEDAGEAAQALNARGYATLGAELRGLPFYERPALPPKLCVLIGNEGAGLRPETLARCTHRYRLPMRGGAESLNAAVAAAIILYDVMNR